MAEDGKYVIRCPSCGTALEVRPEWAGRRAKCKTCGQSLVIPSPREASAAKQAAAKPPAEPAAQPRIAPPAHAAARVTDVSQLRTPGEAVLRVVCLIFSILFYVLFIVSCVGACYLGFVLFGSYIALAFMITHVRGNGIKVAPDQLPQVYESARRASAALGLSEVPDVYVMQKGGILNAFATKFAFRRHVVLYSDLVDACGGSSAELDMVVAHEIGHLALGHITWNWILFPARFIPFLSQAYSRACEYSADRCGWAGCGDKAAATRGLLILAAGGKCGRGASLEAFLRQRNETRGFWQTVVEWLSTHPWLTRRVEAVHCLSRAQGLA